MRRTKEGRNEDVTFVHPSDGFIVCMHMCTCAKPSNFFPPSTGKCHLFRRDYCYVIQGSAKRRELGCVNCLPGAAWL